MRLSPWFTRRAVAPKPIGVDSKPVIIARTETEYEALFNVHSQIHHCDQSQYDMGCLLASGAFGNVHACTDQETGAKFAAKRSNINTRYLVESEVSCLRMFPHPNIVHIVDAFESRRDLWIILEFMEGGDLSQLFVEGKRFPQSVVAFVAKEVLQALSFLHGNDAIHRDIKPTNLLFNTDGRVKLADFGFASVLTKERPTRSTKHGTPGYRAPELICTQEYGTKVDIWSLGVTLMELVQGRRQAWDVGSSRLCPQYPEFDRLLLLDARMFLRSMLMRETEKRASAKDLLVHQFPQSSSCTSNEFLQFVAAGRRKIQQ